MGPMNATVLLAVVRRERLGRLYRVQPPDEAERLRIRKLTHAFYCREPVLGQADPARPG